MILINKKSRIVTKVGLSILLCLGQASFAGDGLSETEAAWNKDKGRLIIKGKGHDGEIITVSNAATGVVIGSDKVDDEKWRVRKFNLASVPCRVKAVQPDGESEEARVRKAPDNCDDGTSSNTTDTQDGEGLSETEAAWDKEKKRLTVKGKGNNGELITVSNAATGMVIGTDEVDDEKWRVRKFNLASIPCRVKAVQPDGQSDEAKVEEAPDNCDAGSSTGNKPVAQDDLYNTVPDQSLFIAAPGVLSNDSDADADVLTALLISSTSSGSLSLSHDGSFSYTPDAGFVGQDSFTYQAQDSSSELSGLTTAVINVVEEGAISINSTSRTSDDLVTPSVAEQPYITNPGYQLLAINDLGMHCGDLDTRISSILPPFNVIHAQVVQRGVNGDEPRIMGEHEVKLSYSAVSSPNDPALSLVPVLAKDGVTLYKTNFWDIARDAYRPFYPSGILDLFYPVLDKDGNPNDIVDIGLPVPDVERFYLEDGFLAAGQQAMPGRSGALISNVPQEFHEHIGTLPFFTGFPFGYTADLNVAEAAGIPIAVYDDSGRKNPYPLMRVQAEVNGETVATIDTVTPISGEAECQRCHAAELDGGNGAAIKDLSDDENADPAIKIAISLDDPADNVPHEASVEWASDINILKLHDLKHGTALNQGYDAATGQANNPVVCQTCHYTPALDLAQFGPLGPENDNVDPIVLNDGAITIDSLANGRDQVKHKSMSNVMHSHHATVTGIDGLALFPDMPPAVDNEGNKRDPEVTQAVLGETCYACHPGNNTECMRGAMANGGQVCQDCHGNMSQVGDDFSRNVQPTVEIVDGVSKGPGQFHVQADYYTNTETPRVPWANEPGCGSCHTGNAMDNMTAQANVMVNPFDAVGNVDGIRLAQAFLTSDSKATPIVPTNKQFAENVVAENTDADGNPKLYRVSTGHGDLLCEGCHGSTHAEWPNANPWANDNVAAQQIQGHSGTVTECTACHDGNLGNTLKGPHGMHAVGDTSFSDGGHEDIAEKNDGDACRACHGRNGEGTVLSRAAMNRTLKNEDETILLAKGDLVTCSLCHENEL
ncbi:MAG: cytochrome C [Gammaproteobacteria bacterium]|nr:cytochrome C [Gammaproteobacteria bacterium]